MPSLVSPNALDDRRVHVSADDETVVLRPRSDEAESYDALLKRIDAVLDHRGVGRLVSPDGSAITVPASLMSALRRAVLGVTQGRAVTIAPQDLEMTTQQAADLLHVSRPHVIKLLDRGDVPHHRTSDHPASHRRVVLQDVLEYRDRRNAIRREALDELTAIAQEAAGIDY